MDFEEELDTLLAKYEGLDIDEKISALELALMHLREEADREEIQNE